MINGDYISCCPEIWWYISKGYREDKKHRQKAVAYKERGNQIVVVVSAMAGETDRLLRLAHEQPHSLMKGGGCIACNRRTGDLCTPCNNLKGMGHDACSILGHQVKIVTDSNFGRPGL
jgi:aspartate kinase